LTNGWKKTKIVKEFGATGTGEGFMRTRSISWLWCVLAGVWGLGWPAGLAAQTAEQQGQTVRFLTADGVELVGTYYNGGGQSAPCVLLLHNLGKGHHSHQAGWEHLAQVLRQKGFNVLSFDFRGHGQSTTVAEPEKFWAIPIHRQLIKKATADQIDVANFDGLYYLYLANDIAAAKSYLDRQNDARKCNSSALVLIGAEASAALAAVWLNSEWSRYKLLPPDPLQQKPFWHCAPEPEGNAVLGAVWLSISPKLGKRTLSLNYVLRTAGSLKGQPMLFLNGDGDKKGKKEAEQLVKELRSRATRPPKFIGNVVVPKAGKAVGHELLQPSLGTANLITTWLEGLVKAKSPEWVMRQFSSSRYIWGTPNLLGQPTPGFVEAKGLEEPVIRWFDYSRFAH
jgi:pimeloyl-ACP methyl ester carboxylesterase